MLQPVDFSRYMIVTAQPIQLPPGQVKGMPEVTPDVAARLTAPHAVWTGRTLLERRLSRVFDRLDVRVTPPQLAELADAAARQLPHRRLDYDRIAELNPRAIFAQVKGFASDSPHADYLAFDMIAQAATDRMRHGDMRHHAGPEKTFLAGKGAVDELVNQDEGAGRQLFFE